jgi:excisionase family DNA binding protein
MSTSDFEVPPIEKAAESVRVLDARWDGHDSFTVEEAGEILKLNRWTAYYSAKKGRIPTIRIGHRLRVPRFALERLLAGAWSPNRKTGFA